MQQDIYLSILKYDRNIRDDTIKARHGDNGEEKGMMMMYRMSIQWRCSGGRPASARWWPAPLHSPTFEAGQRWWYYIIQLISILIRERQLKLGIIMGNDEKTIKIWWKSCKIPWKSCKIPSVSDKGDDDSQNDNDYYNDDDDDDKRCKWGQRSARYILREGSAE